MRSSTLLLALLPSATLALAAGFTTFQDPFEQAFTVDVPQGWTVKGGLFRLGYSDVRPMLDLSSPDGRINIRFGDVAIPAYYVPDQLHPTEGDNYDLGAQAQLTIARYRTGQQYAAIYSAGRFKGVCANPASRQPDAGPPLQDPPQDPPALQNTSGQTASRCDSNRVTYVYATTSLFQGFWTVRTLASFIAPADQAANARSILVRCAASFKVTPRWRQRQKQMDQDAIAYQQARQQQRRRDLSQQVAQFEMQMQGMRNQVGAFERQQARQAGQVESVGNTLTGLTPTVDPLGNPRTVFTGSKNGYWIDGNGRVVNSDLSPGAGWRELKPTQ
jgi:hypothetical protein